MYTPWFILLIIKAGNSLFCTLLVYFTHNKLLVDTVNTVNLHNKQVIKQEILK